MPSGDPALEACELWEAELDAIGEPLPAVEAGLRWLRLNPPAAGASRALVHGDFRLGNLIVDERGLAAVIDWELCHAGDPAEDLGWLCIRSWRFGNDDLPVAGLGELGAVPRRLRGGGRRRPDPERLRWWEAMGNVKWAVICARQAHDHLTGARPSAELASLGRRICEPEWDLLGAGGGLMQDRPDSPRAARRDGRVAVRRGARVGAARAPLPGPGARQPLRGDRTRAARRRPSPRWPTCGCSASCSRADGAARAGARGRRRGPGRGVELARRSAAASSTTRLDDAIARLREHVAPQARGRAARLRGRPLR